MRVTLGTLLGSMLASLVLAGGVAAQDQATAAADQGTVSLKYRTFRRSVPNLPDEKWLNVGPGISFSDRGLKFPATVQGTALQFDANLDGVMDAKVDGEGLVVLSGESEGQRFQYAVRLKDTNGWKYAVGGAVTGRINSTRVQIIDQNGNGNYADFGVDAMIVGRSKNACFLSKVVSIDGKALEIDVAQDGSSLSFTAYEGETGTLKLDVDTKAKVLCSILKSVNGRYSFEIARGAPPVTVPVGRYVLHEGEIGLSSNRMRFRKGRSQPTMVEPGQDRALSWGGPIAAEFAYQRRNDKVGLSPEKVWYYGKGGEQYFAFKPLGKSPKFSFVDKKTGREIATAYFPGTC